MFWFLLYNPYLESSYSFHLPLVLKENTPNHQSNQSHLSSAHFNNMPKHDNPNSENQENLLIKRTSNYNEENLLINMKNGNKAAVMTPNGGAKNVLTNRKVLAEKTPGNGNDESIKVKCYLFSISYNS